MPTQTHTPRLLDTDTSPAALPPDRAVYLRNIIPYDGYTGLTTGTIGIAPTLQIPAGRNTVVGAVADLAGRSIVRFMWNELGAHRLLRTFLDTGVEVLLLAPPLLDLREDDTICQTGIIGDYLGWLDRDGRQYRLNMTVAGAGGYAGITDPFFFRLAKRVPLYAPELSRNTVGAATGPNRIENNDWQVAYRYGYSENDVTVLSPPSVVNKATKGSRGSNALYVVVPGNEIVSVAVQRIEFYARKNTSPTWQRIKTLRRDSGGNFSQVPWPNPIVAGFAFFGRTFGDALSSAEADKLVEAIPQLSQALGAADNRFFLADNTEGYAPTAVGLTGTVEASGENFSVSQRTLFELKTEQIDNDEHANDIEFIARFILVAGTAGQSDARYVNACYNEFLNAYFEVPDARQFTRDELQDEAGRLLAQQGGDQTISGTTAFEDRGPVPYVRYALIPTVKGFSTYQLGVEFVDYAGVSSGTLTNDAAVVTVPDFNLNTTAPGGRRIRWTLAPPTSATAIPSWAVAYRVVWTPHQEMKVFRQVHVAEVLRLETKDTDQANPKFVANSAAGGPLWLDLTPLTAPGKGYVWSADSQDRVRIWESPTSAVFHDYKITGQLGSYLIVDEPQPVAYTRMTRVEIYSPREATADVFYSNGPTYPIVRTPVPGGGVALSYSVLSDTLPPDVFLTTDVGSGLVGMVIKDPTNERYYPGIGGQFIKVYNLSNATSPQTLAPFQAYNRYYDKTIDQPRTKFYGVYNGAAKRLGVTYQPPYGTGGLPGFFEVLTDVVENTTVWLNDRGRPSTVLADGPPLPAHREVDVRWGGVLKPGSQINGLSSWDEDSVVTLGQERGRVVALKLAVQQQETGTVLVAWQAYGQSSLYIGEAKPVQLTGETLSVNTSAVVGAVRGGAGDKGTVHPGSVVGNNGRLWAWSQQAKTVLRYDQSGVTDLCETYRCQRLGRELAALNATRIIGGYDPEAEVYFLTFYYTEAGLLTSRTIGFSERGAGGRDKGFCGNYDFASYSYTSLGEHLFSFFGPTIHRHDPLAGRNTFYSLQHRAEITIVSNADPKRSKGWLSLAYHGADAWDTPLIENEQAGGVVQRSKTLASWATWRQGTYTVALRRDMVKPKYGPGAVLVTDPAQLLHMGYPLQSPWLRVTMQIDTDKDVRLDSVDVNFNFLTGQQAVPN